MKRKHGDFAAIFIREKGSDSRNKYQSTLSFVFIELSMFSEVEMCFEKSFWEEMTASLTAKQNKPK